MGTLQEDLAERIYNNPKFRDDVNLVIQRHFSKFGTNGRDSEIQYDNSVVMRLTESALILASSKNDTYRIISYELATLLYEEIRSEFPGFNAVMKLICTRLENSPAVNLLGKEISTLPVSLEVESNLAIKLSTRTIGQSQLWLTKFQMNAFDLLSKGYTVSLSAPTSAGKSFLITQFVTKKLIESDQFKVAIVVPTRALIRQLSMDFYSKFIEYGLNKNGSKEIELLTSSIEGIGKEASPKLLFILTQERLLSVLNNWKQKPQFDLLIIDESQKIGDKKRGIILEDTIIEIASTHPRIQFIFLSPMSSNPELLLDTIDSINNKEALISSFSPVAQHLYTVKNRKGNRHELIIEKLNSKISQFSLKIKIKSSLPISQSKRLAFLSALLGTNSSNIVYCSGPDLAEKTALALTDIPDITYSTNPDVLETIDYLSEIIHKDYYLVGCLKKGVAYHYGSMPEIARISVEDLFKNELINYVTCTSTLLEGVNLPAKNIFIENPKLGREQMDDSSFWNLAGRAGRLMKDFSGNVICVNPETWDRPLSDIRREYSIKSSLTQILNDEQFLRYCKCPSIEIKIDSCEQAFNTIILKFLEKGEKITRFFIEKRAPSNVNDIMNFVKNIAFSLNLPYEVLKKNKSIDIRFQNEFASWLANLSYQEFLYNVPLQPYCEDYYDNLLHIFKTSDRFFIIINRGERYKYYAHIAHKWTRESSLRDMINSHIEYSEKKEKEVNINKIIRDLIQSLNEEVRYHYVRNTKCFCDIVQYELNRRHINEERYPPYTDFWLPNYLELGMSNVGSIQLHNMGFSRVASIEINRFCRERGVEPKNMINWIGERAIEIARMMPRPIKFEILKIFMYTD